MINHAATPITTHIIPNMRTSGCSAKSSALAIPFIILLATFPPKRKAPENSIIAAITIALFNERAPEPTDVAKAFATSFAPTH